MTVAKIAYDRLTPAVRAKVDALLASNPAPDFSDFVRSATYPDQLKRYGIKAYSQWHAISIPFVRDGIIPGPARADNAIWAVDQCAKALVDEKTIPYEKARMLRFLIHIVGDLHQPLHAATLYDKQHPEGDDNGRGYKLGEGKKDRLHAEWDTAFGIYKDLADSRTADLAEVDTLAANVLKDVAGKTLGDATSTDPEAWAKESHDIAATFAYTTPEGSQPSAEYIAKARVICSERLALAGQRLANLLNKLMG
ncbi:S1/P1 nuclease [Fimbriimonas ginsengisoli Gsoil 348]|uniref:S1/P1 nuclease n=2 Tax=Fimbriimonas ginsengisoli TaxID=1005039 RepID=A0A068NTN9_FIMGI|nr:S1/P1 nuclease [Fimbriimonas ginsengisoli Gsoil 348]